jgi:hypothetical protein
MCRHFDLPVIEIQDPDDKVGNGFIVVIDVSKSVPGKLDRWWKQQKTNFRSRALRLITPQSPKRDGLQVGGLRHEIARSPRKAAQSTLFRQLLTKIGAATTGLHAAY